MSLYKENQDEEKLSKFNASDINQYFYGNFMQLFMCQSRSSLLMKKIAVEI